MTKMERVKLYVAEVKKHRKVNQELTRKSRKYYNSEVRGCISASAFAHDLNKIFSYKIFKYMDMNERIKAAGYIPAEIYNAPFSSHDSWMYSSMVVEMVREMELYKYITVFNCRSTLVPTENELDEVVNNIKMLCELFGEDPRAFYLRNYNCFRFSNSSKARVLIEFLLEIDFDDYFDSEERLVTVYDIFNKNNSSFNPGLAYHAFIKCLTEYGVNIYQALGLTDVYEGINDRVR